MFATVGTDHHPFHRMINWVDSLHGRPGMPDFRVQSGTTTAPTQAPSAPYFTFEEMTDLVRASDAVLCHGGPATIIQVRQSGRIPLVMPRRKAHGEHVDDHQWLFARRLAELDQIELIDTREDLVAALARLDDDPESFRLRGDLTQGLHAAIAEFEKVVSTLMARRPPKTSR